MPGARVDWWSVAVALIVGGVAFFIGASLVAVASIILGIVLVVVLSYGRTKDKGAKALAATTSSVGAGFLGGIAGLVALAGWYSAVRSGLGGLALVFFYIAPHVVFKFGLRFIHPSVYEMKGPMPYTDREVLTFLYALPCALFALSLPLGPALQSILTGRFLSEPGTPSKGMPTLPLFLCFEVLIALFVAVGFYGFRVGMIQDTSENAKSSFVDSLFVGGGNGILILSMAVFAHLYAGFNSTPHYITKEELVNCFLFSALLAGTVFNSYRLRLEYAIKKIDRQDSDRVGAKL